MELSHSQQYSLLDELILSPKIDSNSSTYFPTEFLPTTWTFPPPFDADHRAHFPCPYDEYEDTNALLDSLIASPDSSLPTLPEQLPTFQEISDAATPSADDVITDDGGRKSRTKPKKPDGQPSKNLMAERRRRKRLNDRLSMLRSIVPKISKMDRTSILGDTIDYTKELLDKIRNLRGQQDSSFTVSMTKEINNPNDSQVMRNPPKFEVERRNRYETNVDVCCGAKPGLLLSTLTTLDALGLDVQQCVISCFSDFSFKASCFEVAEHRSLVSSDDVKLALFRNAGYGGRCL